MQLTDSQKEKARTATIFKDIPDVEFEKILDAGRFKMLEADSFCFMEDDPAEKAYLLIEGKIKLAQVTIHGQQVIMGYITPGRVFGIIAALKEVTYPVSSQAVGECKTLYWDETTLNSVLETSPNLALNILRVAARQIREFQNRIRELSTQQVEQRIARAIIRLANQSGEKTDAGIIINLPLSRQDLAEMSGSTMYTVSRVLTMWEKEGIIDSRRQQVKILSPHKLATIAEDILLAERNISPDENKQS